MLEPGASALPSNTAPNETSHRRASSSRPRLVALSSKDCGDRNRANGKSDWRTGTPDCGLRPGVHVGRRGEDQRIMAAAAQRQRGVFDSSARRLRIWTTATTSIGARNANALASMQAPHPAARRRPSSSRKARRRLRPAASPPDIFDEQRTRDQLHQRSRSEKRRASIADAGCAQRSEVR